MCQKYQTPPSKISRGKGICLTLGISLFYGLLARIIYTLPFSVRHFDIVSWSFIGILPFAIGSLTTFLGYKFVRESTFWKLIAPCLILLIGSFIALLTGLEAAICLIVALPVMIPIAMIGGIFTAFILKKNSGNLYVSFTLFLPFLLAPAEKLWEHPHEEVTITDTIEINAPPELVWKEIVSVRPIHEEEIPHQWIYWIGFPKPVSAEIDNEGVNGKRLATFERNVSFFERITEWQPNQRLSFTIEADPEFIPRSAFDQHIIVGGRFYDVLDGTYEIEPTPTGCRLILSSTHRLSTPFNNYSGLWSEAIMNQIQGSILTVIKNRCESAAGNQVYSP